VKGKKSHTMLHLTDDERASFNEYDQSIKQVLEELPGFVNRQGKWGRMMRKP